MSIDAEVYNLVGRYCDAVLRADPVAFATTWCEDARWLIPGEEIIEGRTAIASMFEKIRPTYRQCVQEILNGTVDHENVEAANARWQVRELQWRYDGTVSELIGVYHDTMVRDPDGVLRFSERDFELIYSGPIDGTGRLRTPREL